MKWPLESVPTAYNKLFGQNHIKMYSGGPPRFSRTALNVYYGVLLSPPHYTFQGLGDCRDVCKYALLPVLPMAQRPKKSRRSFETPNEAAACVSTCLGLCPVQNKSIFPGTSSIAALSLHASSWKRPVPSRLNTILKKFAKTGGSINFGKKPVQSLFGHGSK